MHKQKASFVIFALVYNTVQMKTRFKSKYSVAQIKLTCPADLSQKEVL
jgi:hypothetical protein